jgi:diguanylate cyclase (GGDEF)-like protein
MTSLPKLSRLNPVWWLNAALAAAALGLFLGGTENFPAIADPHLPWWVLAVAFLIGERCVVHLQFGRNAHSFSLGDLPLVFGLLFSTAHDLLLGGLAGTAVVLILHRRLPPIKLVFNLAQVALTISAAAIIVNAFASPGDELGPQVWLATLFAIQVGALLSVLLLGLAISIGETKLQARTLWRMLAMDLVVTVTNGTLALAGAVLISTDPRAIPLLLVPVATVFLAYRAYLLQQHRHEKLEFLYEATRTLSRAPEIVLALEGLLARTLEAFGAELAEIVFFSSEPGQPPLRTTLGPREKKDVMQPIDQGLADELRSLVTDDVPAAMLSRPFPSERLARYLGERRVTDAMVAMLPGEKRIIGTMMLANRAGVVHAFTEDDLKLFETLANNASVALQYDRLEQAVLQLRELQEQLHHQAFHDPLTDLGNRSLFINQVRDALSDEEGMVAVLFIDLDDFKTLNDSLGHAAGDDLLVAVAHRLRQTLRPDDVVARLGGDEFAVMIRDRRNTAQSAVEVAQRVLKAFEKPLTSARERPFNVHLSVGIATTLYTRQADELIRNADLAMYRAKDMGKGRYELFDPKMRDAVLKRHGLKEELEKAIEGDELAVDYQPIVDLRNGEVVAAEALVRWHHPGRGVLPPSEFIPLAEESGQIVAVGRFVFEEACRKLAAWQSEGKEDTTVHVNLSAIELKDKDLVDNVISALAERDLRPQQVVFEITESVVQDDATAKTLRRLRNAGVRLALDDFGTGYSSLSYLRSLPLHILKIAKPFVEGIADGRQESSFVRMIIDLARALDLQVIAEGIETPEQLVVLRDLGCELGQGFHLDDAVAEAGVSAEPAVRASAATSPGARAPLPAT